MESTGQYVISSDSAVVGSCRGQVDGEDPAGKQMAIVPGLHRSSLYNKHSTVAPVCW